MTTNETLCEKEFLEKCKTFGLVIRPWSYYVTSEENPRPANSQHQPASSRDNSDSGCKNFANGKTAGNVLNEIGQRFGRPAVHLPNDFEGTPAKYGHTVQFDGYTGTGVATSKKAAKNMAMQELLKILPERYFRLGEKPRF